MVFFNTLRTIYRKYLKGTWIGEHAKSLFLSILRRIRTIRIEKAELLLAGIPDASVCKLEAWSDYCAAKAIGSFPLYSEERRVVVKPRLIPDSLSHVLKQERYEYEVPKGDAFFIEEGKLIGGSDFIFVDDYCLHNAHCDFLYDYTSEELHGRALISPAKRRVVWYEDMSTDKKLDAGVNLLGSCTKNYAHWLSETLPKIALMDDIEQTQNFPLLVDADLPSQIMESIQLLNNGKREIIEIQAGERVQVKNLLLIESPGYVPFQPRNEKSPISRHGSFSTSSIKRMVTVIKQRMSTDDMSKRNNIFLKRGNTYRALKNEIQVESLLRDRGFIVLDPGSLSFAEQVQTFSNASMIVGATGAGFANLLFAPEDCRIIILASANSLAAYYYWQILASTVGNSVTYILGTAHDEEQPTVHADYQIDVSNLLAEIDNQNVKLMHVH